MPRWPRRVLLGAVALATAAGCAVSEPGTPVRAPGGPPPDAVDVALLGSGNYPTEPAPPLGIAGSAAAGALIEARRMADNVVGPWEVDPSLATPSPLRAMVMNDPATLVLIEPGAVAAAARPHHLVNGFASDRQGPAQLRLMNAVLRFPDAPSASAAATDMAAAASAASTASATAAQPVAGHPDARAVVSGDGSGPVTVFSYTPHGMYVLCQTAQADQDTASALVATALDLQEPLIDKFSPTDPANFAQLPADPGGLLARTMSTPTWPAPKDTGPTDPKTGTYLPHAALHLANDPPRAATALAAAGVSAMSYRYTIVYQARDPAAAGQLVSELSNALLQDEPSAEPFNGVDFMPTSSCVRFQRPDATTKFEYFCFAPAGRFTIETHASDPTGARQQTAAQYKMLMAA